MDNPTLKYIKQITQADTAGRKRNPERDIVLRREFFYTHGKTAQDFANGVHSKLNDCLVDHDIVDYGEHWAPFRGGASTAQSSHWWVVIRLRSGRSLVTDANGSRWVDKSQLAPTAQPPLSPRRPRSL